MVPEELKAERIRVPDSLEAVNRLFYGRRWTDGLPIVPPTEERVEAMLKATSRPPQAVVGVLPPRWAEATVEKIAINAVMAGCLPSYLPVVLAAVEAVADEKFNLYGVQATTNPVHPMLIVNGPIAKELGMNASYGCFGPGNMANATIGRALRLILMNIGGGLPGLLDRATTGQPGKYAFCFAENEEASPWPPFHVERGFRPEESTVTAFGAGGILNIIDMVSTRALGLLTTIAHSLTAVGINARYTQGEAMVLFCPEHAEIVAREDFSKEAAKRFLWENSQVPLSHLSPEVAESLVRKRREEGEPPFADLPVATSYDCFHLAVAGGAGPHSSFVPGALSLGTVTKLIKK